MTGDSGTEKKLLLLGCFLLSVGFFITGLQCFWADSEIWHLKISSLQGDARNPYDYWIKPVYLIFLSVIYNLSDVFGTSHPNLGRWVFGLNGVALLTLGSMVVTRFYSSSKIASVFFLLVGSSWIWLERGFRIRSDLMATCLFLVFLLLVIDGLRNDRFSHRRLWVLFGLFVATIMVTPKSLLLFLCFLPFLYKVFLSLPLPLHNKVINLILLCLAAFVGMSIFSESFFISLLSQKTYLEGSLIDAGGEIGAFSQYRWEHVGNFLVENPLIWVLFFLKVFWIFRNWRDWVSQGVWRNLDISFLLLAPALVLFPNRTPFFICSLVPLFVLFLFSGTEKWIRTSAHNFHRYRKPIYVVVVLVLVAAGYKMDHILKNHNNLDQKQLYVVLKAFSEAYPQKTIYDPAGISPSRKAVHFYLGPGDLESNRTSSSLIRIFEPDIILAGQRLHWTKPHLDKEFLLKYRDFSRKGIFQKGHLMESMNSKTASRIKGYNRIEIKEVLDSALESDISPENNLWVLPLTREGAEIPDVIFELEDGSAIPQLEKGLKMEMVLKARYLHLPELAGSILVFEKTPYLLNEFNMSNLLRFDPEL